MPRCRPRRRGSKRQLEYGSTACNSERKRLANHVRFEGSKVRRFERSEFDGCQGSLVHYRTPKPSNPEPSNLGTWNPGTFLWGPYALPTADDAAQIVELRLRRDEQTVGVLSRSGDVVVDGGRRALVEAKASEILQTQVAIVS